MVGVRVRVRAWAGVGFGGAGGAADGGGVGGGVGGGGDGGGGGLGGVEFGRGGGGWRGGGGLWFQEMAVVVGVVVVGDGSVGEKVVVFFVWGGWRRLGVWRNCSWGVLRGGVIVGGGGLEVEGVCCRDLVEGEGLVRGVED